MKLSAASLFAVLFTANAVGQDANRFASPTVGFEVAKPAPWVFMTADQNLENLRRAEMDDKKFQALMLKFATAPLVAMAKHPEPFDDVNPSFKVNIRPLGQFKGSPPTAILDLMAPTFQRMFKDYSVVEPPRETKVSGLTGAYMRIHYSMQIPDGRTFPISSQLWIVPRGDYFFMIGAGTRQDEKTGTRKEVQAILDSVRIAP